MKTNKHKTLLLAKSQGTVNSLDLMRKYEYSAGTARSYLSHLGQQGLLQRTNGRYVLTKKATTAYVTSPFLDADALGALFAWESWDI